MITIRSVHCVPTRAAAWTVSILVMVMGGCRVLEPIPISMVRNTVPTNLIADDEPQMEVGRPRKIIDGIGWVVGIPSKLMFWNRKVENHSVSAETQLVLDEYLKANSLNDVKVRVNQYRPGDDWRRLTRNTSVAWPWRYTFGAVSLLGETILPGRVFGGDHYNPFTATIHLYSDLPSIALHEAAHAKDFSNRRYPGSYAAIYVLPLVPLWHERIATNDVLSYVQYKGDPALRREAYHILYPAYGTYAGSAAGYFTPKYSYPVYLAGVVAGHAIGRRQAAKLESE
jgi:hypothetical protein